jgi:8-oxo-dGTP pyrophosphatase MutT (NUDIX family)
MRYTKVLAYITRTGSAGAPELLVFDHDQLLYPDAGTQVPAGTVDQGETIEQALLREIEEETGLRGCEIVTRLAVYEWEHPDTHNTHERHVYHVRAPEITPDRWTWVETSGGAVPEHEGYEYFFRWLPLSEPIDLAGNQGDYLHMLDGTSRTQIQGSQ